MAFLCDSEAVVLHVELYRYALLGDEKVGCRHFPLLFQEHLSGGKSQHFEAFVRDSVNPEHKHYFSLEISCDQLCSSSTYSQSQFSSFSFSSLSPSSRTSPPPFLAASSTSLASLSHSSIQSISSCDSSDNDKISSVYEQIKRDLTNLGVTDEYEIDSCLKLGRKLYYKRKAYKINENPSHDTTEKGAIPMYCDGYRLLSFVRGFQEEALDAVTRTAIWRASEDVNKIRAATLPSLLGCSVAEFEKYYQAGLLGINTDGSPIVVRRFGALNVQGLSEVCGIKHGISRKTHMAYFKEEHIWEMEHYYELLRAQSMKHGKIVKGIVVMDLDGIGMKQLAKESMMAMRKLINDDSNNYPDTLSKLYIVNTPSIFNFVWRIVRPWLHPVVLAKIEICKKNRTLCVLKEAGCSELCLGAHYGCSAVPIDGVTNEFCMFPFGGRKFCPPNAVTDWNCDIISQLIATEMEGDKEEEKKGEMQKSTEDHLLVRSSPTHHYESYSNYHQAWRSGTEERQTDGGQKYFVCSVERQPAKKISTKRDETELLKLMLPLFLVMLVSASLTFVFCVASLLHSLLSY